jgi:hypothetical protein
LFSRKREKTKQKENKKATCAAKAKKRSKPQWFFLFFLFFLLFLLLFSFFSSLLLSLLQDFHGQAFAEQLYQIILLISGVGSKPLSSTRESNKGEEKSRD